MSYHQLLLEAVHPTHEVSIIRRGALSGGILIPGIKYALLVEGIEVATTNVLVDGSMEEVCHKFCLEIMKHSTKLEIEVKT